MPLTPRRPALAAILVGIIGAMAVLSMANAAPNAATSTNAIVARALQDTGTWQGECWPWVRKVVEEATDHTMGFDYREGFFEAGAVEVKPANARPGDVIQLADDSHTAPDADYLGLHTAIVMENLGNGKFKVIDSNSNWDGMVRIREYDPGAAAARYANISYHVYRFPNVGEVLVSDPPTPEIVPSPFVSGDSAVTNTPSDCLNLRSGAGSNFAAITCLKDRTVVKIAGDTVNVSGRKWTKVTTSAGTGWVASDFLTKTASGAGGAGTGVTRPAPTFRLFVPSIGSDK